MGGPGSGRRKFDLPEVSFARCPKGHKLPYRADGIDCSPAACGRGVLDGVDPPVDPAMTPALQEELETQRIAGREKLRRRLIPVPEGLTGADADEWVERRIVELQPTAIAEMEWQLRHGDDAERDRAARFLLDAGGHGKKDRTGQAANMIVINMGPGASPPPLPYVGQVVEAATKAAKTLQDAPALMP